MKIFVMTVKAIGYETILMTVHAPTLSKAFSNANVHSAMKRFAEHNDISMSDAKGFGSVSCRLA